MTIAAASKHSPLIHDEPRDVGPSGDGRPNRDFDPVAIVVATRPHDMRELLPALLRSGFSALEPSASESLRLVRDLQPDLVVAVVDPTTAEDVQTLRALAESSDGFRLVLAPSPDGFAAAFDAGADACLSDADAESAMVAQFRAIERRRRASIAEWVPDHDEFGEMALDYKSHRATVGGKVVPLTPLEFSILQYLVSHPGAICRPVHILHALDGRLHDEQAAAQRVKVHIWRLRAKLREAGLDEDLITNIRGLGYLFDYSPGS